MKVDASKIIEWLRQDVSQSKGNVETQMLVLKFGREFKMTQRPTGMPLGQTKKCFSNAANLVEKNKVMYVEGYASSGGPPFHHAWISLDGRNAIDVTIRERIEEITFFGILFPWALWLELAQSTGTPFLSPPINPLLSAYLARRAKKSPLRSRIRFHST